ncbi:MAG: hypothetical protein DRP85_01225 [Candidatus Makaraimicrobium thalassicum]|nr:MAG: hypothetical protein DRP85_01225 [Candidatus Omnitrophota bacterium]
MDNITGRHNGPKSAAKSQKGMILVLVMSFTALMVLGTVSLSTMIQRDVRLIERIQEKEQARFLAEAGINHALASIIQSGDFASRANFTGNLDTGSYNVTYSTVGSRHLVTAVGTVSGGSETASAELADNTPTALNYFSGAGGDIKINALVADAAITGDIHANNNVYLKSGPVFSWLTITGDVSATGIVKEGTRYNQGSWDWWDNHVVINGDANDTATVYEGRDRITFPTFDYASYQAAATASGDYYSSDQVFNSETLSPANGIVYVDGDATFFGPCTLNGGIIADEIFVRGTLTQNKAGNRNVIMAKDGDIRVFGRLYTQEALVYAAEDIKSLQVFAKIDINGIMLAREDILMWNVITSILYNYIHITPSDMMGENGEDLFELVSWNR